MASPLETSLAKTLYRHARSVFLDATLARDGAPSGPGYDPTPGTEAIYTCKAIHEEYSEHDRLQGLVQAGERKVLILAGSISVTPTSGDRITIRGRTFAITDVATDPAQAVWVCKARA